MATLTPTEHAKKVDAWREKRLAKLKGEDGWLSLIDLRWLEDGQYKVGGGKDNDIVIPSERAPADIGILKVREGRVFFWAAPGFGVARPDAKVEAMELLTDKTEQPTVIRAGKVSFNIIERSGKLGLRIKDAEAPTRINFKGVEHFPVDMKWRVAASFTPYLKPEEIKVPTVAGVDSKEVAPGTLNFMMGGKNLSLKAFAAEKGSLWVVFGDQTNGKDTYGGGRFVYVEAPENGKTFIDFNQAYNPPCAFSKFSTCPLPPSGNRLPIRVEAGELKYEGQP